MNFQLGGPSSDSRNGALTASAPRRTAWAKKMDQLRARHLLTTNLDALDIGLEIWDDKDRLVLYNRQDNHLRKQPFAAEDIGRTHATLQHILPNRHAASHTGKDIESLKPLEHARDTHCEPVLEELPGDRWVKNYEAVTPEGYLLIVRVNVTELVRQGRQLEAANRKLAQLSSTDALTGLANRRSFDELLLTEWQRATRTGTDLCLLMVDIDHFKKYNDHYGHMAGDVCLRRVGAVLSQCVRRAGEIVARYGGEEFVLLLPATSAQQAQETAEKCLRLMQQEGIAHADSPTAPHVTLSIGLACLHKGMAYDASDLLNAADTAMYRAKTQGRARYAIASLADWDIDTETPRNGAANGASHGTANGATHTA